MTSNSTANQVEGWLWADVARLALAAGSGRLEHSGILAAGLRGALFVDAVERGVISNDDGQLQFGEDDGTELIAALVTDLKARAGFTLAEHLQRGGPHLAAFITVLTDAGVWRRHGMPVGTTHSHYDDDQAGRYEALRGQLASASTPTSKSALSPHDAALRALATVLNLGSGSARALHELPDAVITAAGDLGWIVADVTTYLLDAQSSDLAAGQVDGTTNVVQLGLS